MRLQNGLSENIHCKAARINRYKDFKVSGNMHIKKP